MLLIRRRHFMTSHCDQSTEADAELTVSIIIPVINEAGIITESISSLRRVRGRYEVIIVDGGSDDDTRHLVSAAIRLDLNYRLIESSRGRGNQLNAGASIARGRALVFLHADTRLPDSAIELIERALQEPDIVGGNFRLEYDGPGLATAIFTRLNSLRRWFGIYYGDSAIWATSEAFRRIGGFTSTRLMEDYELCRSLEQAGRTICFDQPVVASARRWHDHSVVRTLVVWTLIQWLYMIGVSSDRLAGLYYPGRF
jgi:rSAM/selenodomain-associated transferase 2